MDTCCHFRNMIPREDADELRAADPEPCEICDNLRYPSASVEEWNPKPVPAAHASMAVYLAQVSKLIGRAIEVRTHVLWAELSRLLLRPVCIPCLSRRRAVAKQAGC